MANKNCPCGDPGNFLTWESHLPLCGPHAHAWLESNEKKTTKEVIAEYEAQLARLRARMGGHDDLALPPTNPRFPEEERRLKLEYATRVDEEVAPFIDRITHRPGVLDRIQAAISILFGGAP